MLPNAKKKIQSGTKIYQKHGKKGRQAAGKPGDLGQVSAGEGRHLMGVLFGGVPLLFGAIGLDPERRKKLLA